MSNINQLSLLSSVSAGDQLAVYAPSNGDTRRLAISSLLTYFQQNFASPTLATSHYVPSAGFSISVPTPVSEQQWLILQPVGTLATGTITLPLNTSTPDGTEVLLTTTQQITLLTIGLNGASSIYGWASPGAFTAGAFMRLRFYSSTNSWYRIS